MFNTYVPVSSIFKPERINPGGLCKILCFKHEDVDIWPRINPTTGTITTAIVLKAGAGMYQIISADKERAFTEELKAATEGDYFDMQLTCMVPGNTVETTLALETMRFHRWGVIFLDRNGEQRLIGDRDQGAKLFYDYQSADGSGSRKRHLRFVYQHPMSAPIYLGDAFTIPVGGVVITAGCLTLVARFRVGAPGAPMAEGDTVFTSSLLTGNNVFVVADGTVLNIDDGTGAIDYSGSIERRVEKTKASDTANFIGGVVNNEILSIYAYSI